MSNCQLKDELFFEASLMRESFKVLSVDNISYLKAADVSGWRELEYFPLGSCQMISHFFGVYLKDKGYESQVICCENKLTKFPNIKTHSWLVVNEHYVDITFDQFTNEIDDSVLVFGVEEDSVLRELAIAPNNSFDRVEPISSFASQSGCELYGLLKLIRDEFDKMWDSNPLLIR